MTQIGTVIRTDNGKATVSVRRSAACKGCSAAGCMGCNKTIEVSAENDAGASEGDKVEIESSSALILKYAVLVFLMPVVTAMIFYCIGYYFLFGDSAWSYLFALIPFAGSLAILYFFVEKKAAKETVYVITNVIADENASYEDAESTDKK